MTNSFIFFGKNSPIRIGRNDGFEMSRFLFTTLPTNDFGLLTRSLPIAYELKNHGHEIAFCHPARGPQILIAEAGFVNLKSNNPMHYLGADFSLQ
jgi:hypothetical protein